MKKIEGILIAESIINKSALAKKIGLSKQVLNNKIKGNNKNQLSVDEKRNIKGALTDILTDVIKSE